MTKMKKVFKIFLVLAIMACMFPVSISAEEPEDTEVTPYWWPGNPNPQPGTEDWFFQNPTYGTNSPDPVARECGKKAIYDALVPSLAIDAFIAWYAKRKFDLYTFGLSFVVNVTYNYAACLWSSGVR